MYSRDYHEVRATSERPMTATRRNHLSIKAFGHAAWAADAAAEVQREAAATLAGAASRLLFGFCGALPLPTTLRL